jgi:hypothetical protein
MYFQSNPLKWLNTEMIELRLQDEDSFRKLHHPNPMKPAV